MDFKSNFFRIEIEVLNKINMINIFLLGFQRKN